MGPNIAEKDEYVAVAAVTAIMIRAGEYRLGEVNQGPFVEGTERAIRTAEKLDEMRKRRFDYFFLIVPGIYVAALWLQDRDGEADILLTIPPSNSALVADRPMAAAEFLDILQDLAEKLTGR